MLDLLNDVSLLLANAPASVDSQPVGTGNEAPGWFAALASYGLIPLLLLVFIVMIWLPQRRRDKETTAQLAAMGKGDKVRSIGGIIGTVMSVDGDEVVVKVDESSNTKLRFAKSAIAVVTPRNAPSDGK